MVFVAWPSWPSAMVIVPSDDTPSRRPDRTRWPDAHRAGARTGTVQLDDDRQHHRALAGQLRRHRREGVVQPLLHQLHLLDALGLAVVEAHRPRRRGWCRAASSSPSGASKPAHDHLGIGDHVGGVGGDRGDDDQHAVGGQAAAVAQHLVAQFADAEAVDQRDPRLDLPGGRAARPRSARARCRCRRSGRRAGRRPPARRSRRARAASGTRRGWARTSPGARPPAARPARPPSRGRRRGRRRSARSARSRRSATAG